MFLHIAEGQEQRIINIFIKLIKQRIKRLNQYFNSNLKISDAIQLIFYIFRSRYNRLQFILTQLTVVSKNYFSFTSNIIKDALVCKNILKNFINETNIQNRMYLKAIQIVYPLNSCIYEHNLYKRLFCYFFFAQPHFNNLVYTISHLKPIHNNLIFYLKKYDKLMWSCCRAQFNKKRLQEYCRRCRKKVNQSIKEYFVASISHRKMNSVNQLNFYHLLHRLALLSDSQFKEKFGIKTDKDVEQLSNLIFSNCIINANELKQKIKLSYYSEVIWLDIWGAEIIQNLNNDINKLIFDTNNKIIVVTGISCVILCPSCGADMQKHIIQDNEQIIEYFLSNIPYEDVFDIIITSWNCLYALQNIKMRFFNYFYNGTGNCKLKLKFPDILVSLSIQNLKIVNFNELVNLKNLFSKNVKYIRHDFEHIRKMERIYSIDDVYSDPNTCMLEFLFQRNKLQFVSIRGSGAGNIANSFILSYNITNLRFFEVKFENFFFDIKIDVSYQFPENIFIFNIGDLNDINKVVIGPENEVKRFKQKLAKRNVTQYKRTRKEKLEVLQIQEQFSLV